MFKILMYLFLFFCGSLFGWVLELFFRRIVHGKWVNPGFLVGPYLPIYGFSLCGMTLIYNLFKSNIPSFVGSDFVTIIGMGLFITFLELIGGLSFIYGGKVKLWDYSKEWGNYKGIICPLFTLIWTIAGAVYYYFLATPVIDMVMWLSHHMGFCFFIGYFYGIITIDFVYSTKLLIKIRKFADDNNLVIRYEELRLNIKKMAEKNKEKYSFLFSLNKNGLINENLRKIFFKRINKGE